MRTIALLILGVFPALSAEPVFRVLQSSRSGQEILRNGDFAQAPGGKPDRWTAGPKGFEFRPGEGRNGSGGIVCHNETNTGWFGASQTVLLNRTEPAPLVVNGWSRAENVSGSADSDYSIYVDLVYQDGTPLYGQTGNFRCGTHPWQQRRFLITPDRPVKSVTIYCLFRNHSGKAWFDDLSIQEIQTGGSSAVLQGVAVVAAAAAPKERTGPAAGKIVSGIADRPSTEPHREFIARDVAANSDWWGFPKGTCAELGLQLRCKTTRQATHLAFEGEVQDTTGKDRAVTLMFALPVDASGWFWGDDIRRSRVIQGGSEFANLVTIRCGSTETASLYPLAAIWNQQTGLALGIDMAWPGQYRLTYHAGLKLFFIACDFGLSAETANFPSKAPFRFVLYEFEPRWGFRAAFQKFTTIFPEHFQVRSAEQGIWMPFTDVAKVQGWQDFGFRYHEGNNNILFDDTNGILSFRYTEPMTWWMRMDKGVPRTPAQALLARDRLATNASSEGGRMARALQVSAMFDPEGQPWMLFRNEPWCDGVVWSLNPNPDLPGVVNGATAHWSPTIKDRLYGPSARGRLDGEYLDSIEGYVTADLNFRREHFRYTSVPLTFAGENHQLALFKGLAVAEFTRWLARDVHAMGKLMFANGVPYRFSYLCPWLDVMGTETDWLSNGQYRPSSDSQMSLWRTMSCRKPYVLLMNTRYDAFGPEMVEKYFQRSAFYGCYPSMFSHNASENPYWQNPKWYNRDRPLFRKYIPIIRQIAQAGWQPVTQATCDNPALFVERFGAVHDGNLYFTTLNDCKTSQAGAFKPDFKSLGVAPWTAALDMVSGQEVNLTNGAWKISHKSQQAGVWRKGK